jgi:hypothetical protein
VASRNANEVRGPGRDIARGGLVEAELDRLVEKRHDRRAVEEGEGG